MIAFIKRSGAWLVSRKVELGLGVRVTVAALSALVIALACGLKLPLWAVLTSLIVTQMSVGRSLKATRDYLIGTVGGAIYGGAVAVLVPHTGESALLAVLVIGGGAAGIHRRDQSKPQCRDRHRHHRAAVAGHEPQQSAGLRDRPGPGSHGRRHHRPCGIVSGVAVACA